MTEPVVFAERVNVNEIKKTTRQSVRHESE